MHTLSLVHSSTVIALHGPDVLPPVRCARRHPPKPDGLRAVETIDVAFEGLPAEIQDKITEIARLLALIERYEAGLEAEPVCLKLAPFPGGGSYTTRLLSFRLELLEAGSLDLAAGRLGLRLHLARAAFWEGGLAEVELSNGSQGSTTSGLLVYNHFDQDPHANDVEVHTAAIEGDLPASAVLVVENGLPGAGELGDLWVGQSFEPVSPAPGQVLEGEAGGGALISSGTASAGGYSHVTAASPSAGVELLSWTIDGLTLAGWSPGPLRPLLRLANLPLFTDLWVYWKASAGGLTWESERMLLSSAALQELPVIDLAPGVTWGTPAALTLRLMARGEGSSYSLDVDCVQFFSAGAYRIYKAFSALPFGGTLVDDGERVYSLNSLGEKLSSHARLGSPLVIYPARSQRFLFAHPGAVTHPLLVSMLYRPRWSEM